MTTEPAELNLSNRVFGVVDRADVLRESGLAFLQGMIDGRHPAPPFAEVCEMGPIELEHGRVVFAARPSTRFYNPLGTVHGGWISTVLDSVMGCAVHSMLKSGQAYTTAEMKINFLRPVFAETGMLRCEGKIIHIGRQLATSEGRLWDAAGKLIAHGTETCVIIAAPPGGH